MAHRHDSIEGVLAADVIVKEIVVVDKRLSNICHNTIKSIRTTIQTEGGKTS